MLQYKLEHAESKIKSLEINIDSLNKENQSLKEYINKIENNNFQLNNLDENYNETNNLFLKEDYSSDYKDKCIEKVMFSINYFIKKMYNLFTNAKNEKIFEDLKYEQFNELQQNLNKIESLINDFYIENIKKINYSINDKSLIDNISSIEYTKKSKNKPNFHKIIKKLENKSKSAKRIRRKSKIGNNSYNNLHYDYGNNKNKNSNQLKRFIRPY